MNESRNKNCRAHSPVVTHSRICSWELQQVQHREKKKSTTSCMRGHRCRNIKLSTICGAPRTLQVGKKARENLMQESLHAIHTQCLGTMHPDKRGWQRKRTYIKATKESTLMEKTIKYKKAHRVKPQIGICSRSTFHKAE